MPIGIERDDDEVVVRCDDGRRGRRHRTRCSRSARCPNTEGLGLEAAGVEVDDGGYVPINHHCQRTCRTSTPPATCRGKLPLSSVAAMQGRKIAEHVMGLHTREHRHLDYDKAASAIFTEPEIADVGLAEAEAFADGPQDPRHEGAVLGERRRRSSTTTPGASSRSSPTPPPGVVLGGSIVGRHAAELISVIALAVTANLKVSDIVESLLVHPALAEALADAAE